MTAETTGGAKTVKYLGLLGAIGAVIVAAIPAGPAPVADSCKDKRVKIIAAWPGSAFGGLTDAGRR